jgi:leucyl/phenylalanyl-tRNA--protein transferase
MEKLPLGPNSPNYNLFFKNPKIWDRDLVAVGGDFQPERLLYAYKHGIFPWSENPIRWYSLDPRAIFDLNRVHFSRTVLRKIKKDKFKITFNKDFASVVKGCSYRLNDSTWITPGFIRGYQKLHSLGWAHSVEAWNPQGELVGGVYGVAIGKFFAGESMFSLESDAGKVSLFYLMRALLVNNFQLFDTQQINSTTWELGAFEIPKLNYLKKLEDSVQEPEPWFPPLAEDQIRELKNF